MKRFRVVILGVTATVLLVATAAAAAPTRFKDVPADHTFSVAINWMAENGITRGCNPPTNDMFCPDDYVTRGQMSAFLKRLVDSDVMPAGAQGPKGDKGAPGAQGPKGDKGATGAIGAAGATGASGAQGPKGDTGAQGLQGIQGLPGLPGSDGTNGLPGLPGADGLPGAAGAQGLPGADGANGAAGAQGLPGADGANGAAGAQGLPGADGAQGPKGDTGATGAQGLQGLPGAAGAQGPKGDTGATGAQGIQGPAGPHATFTRVEGTISANDSTSPKTVTATCPNGGVVVGGGHLFGGSDSVDLHVVSSYPSNATTWSVTGAEADAAPILGNWTVRAYAICAS